MLEEVYYRLELGNLERSWTISFLSVE